MTHDLDHRDEAPARGSWSPWGAVEAASVLTPAVTFVSTASHGGAWVAPDAQNAIPEAITPRHGRTWWEEDCEVWVPMLVFDLFNNHNPKDQALRILAHLKGKWLDILSEPCGVPTAVQMLAIDAFIAEHKQRDATLHRIQRDAATGRVRAMYGRRLLEVTPTGALVATRV